MAQTFRKDSDAVLDYEIDYAAWLGDDTIATSTWDVPTGLIKDSDTNTTTTTTIWLSGGTVGEIYRVTNHIVTAGGREDDRTIKIRVTSK